MICMPSSYPSSDNSTKCLICTLNSCTALAHSAFLQFLTVQKFFFFLFFDRRQFRTCFECAFRPTLAHLHANYGTSVCLHLFQQNQYILLAMTSLNFFLLLFLHSIFLRCYERILRTMPTTTPFSICRSLTQGPTLSPPYPPNKHCPSSLCPSYDTLTPAFPTG